MEHELKLISFELCPFVQRSVITLEEKGIDYEIDYIDLSAKPEWFLALSPSGKVPLLLVGDTVLFESAAINEYLDETTGKTRLQPADALQRAHNRAWIEFASAATVDVHKLMVADSEQAVAIHRDALFAKFTKLEQTITLPLFNGEDLALVDAAFAPMLQRASWCDELAALGIFDAHPRVRGWRDHLLARPSVVSSTVPDIKERFMRYLAGDRGQNNQQQGAYLLRMNGIGGSK